MVRGPAARRKKSQLQRPLACAFLFEVASTRLEQIIQRNEAQKFFCAAFQYRHPRKAFLCHPIHNHPKGFIGIRFDGIQSHEITEGASQYCVTFGLQSFAYVSSRQHAHKSALSVNHWQ
jgi:hypothetical protein